MTAPALNRRPVPAGAPTDPLIAFIEAHPAPLIPFEPRWGLSRLVSSPDGIFDLATADGRSVAVAALVDTAINANDAADLVLLGIDPAADRDALALLLLQEAEAAIGKSLRTRLEIEAADLFEGRQALLEAHGFQPAYHMYVMHRRFDGPPPPVPPLPEGLRWARPTEETMESQHRAASRAMFGVPGANIPDFESFAARARAMPDQHGLVLAGDNVVGFLRVHLPKTAGGEGDVALIGRDPDARGKGLGEILVAEALRRLYAAEAGTAVLEVAAVNEAALALYRRHGFAVTESVTTYARVFPKAGPKAG